MQQHIRGMMVSPFNGAQAITLNQQRQDIKHLAPLTAQRLKAGAFVRTEGVLTRCTIQASLHITVNFNISSIHSTKITTRSLSTPVLFELHRASPPTTIILRVMLNDELTIAFTA
ncbi:MAG: hypothetical protein LC737_05250 [Chloroflexi bacterium]|nr:hypothetical protein [Chloroflexota bacterium]